MKDRSSRAMDLFLASVERRAFRMAQIAVANTEDALDIVQDAMLELVKRYADKPQSNWKPLFYRILMSRIRDCYRRRSVRNRWRSWLQSVRREDSATEPDPMEALPAPAQSNPDTRVIVRDAMAALDKAVQALPLRQQQAFLLRAWEGFSVRETATAMSCSEGSVKTHYSRAIHTLRNQLGDHWP